MRRVVLLVAVAGLLAGCVEAGTEAIDDARARHAARQGTEEATSPGPPTPRPPAAWPHEGSHVEYEVRHVRVAGGAENATSARVRWTYEDDAWRGACALAWRDGARNGTLRVAPAAAPPIATRAPPAEGGEVTVPLLAGCAATSARGTLDEVLPDAYVAREPPGAPEDLHARWDPATGLVTSWTWSRGSEGTAGELVSSDAP